MSIIMSSSYNLSLLNNLTWSYIHAGALNLWISHGNGSIDQNFTVTNKKRNCVRLLTSFGLRMKKLWNRMGSFQTSYMWKSSSIKYGKSYLWHNLYANPFTEVLGLVGWQVTPKFLGIGPSEMNWKEYKHVQRGKRSRLHND